MKRSFLKTFPIVAQLAGLLIFPTSVYALIPNDPQLNLKGGVEMLQLPQAWDITQGSSDVIIAVIDAGVDITNPDLTDNIWLNPEEKSDGVDNDGNGLIDDVHGWNFVNDNQDVRSSAVTANASRIGTNHGSVIAGIIAAVGDNAKGGAGINWRAKIMPLKILDDRGDGDTDLAVKAIDYAIQKKANIINLSFVGPTPSLDFIQAVRRAYRAGILVVAAAGNAPEGQTGTNLNLSPQYPVCFDDPLKEENWVIGVAALNDQGQLAAFSNFGSKCVDIAAPGSRLPSTILFDPLTNDMYGGAWSGTSIAAPFVTGVAALVKALQPTWGPDEIRKALFGTVDSIPGNVGHEAGLGSVNAFKAVQYAKQGGDGGLPKGFYIAPVKTARGTVAHIFDTKFNETKNFIVAPANAGDIRLTSADVQASGVGQIIATVPNSKGSLVRIFQRDGKLIKEFRPFGKSERGVMSVTALDIDTDGSDELIVSSDKLKRVMIFDSKGSVRATISVPESNGSLIVGAYRSTDRAIIVTAVQQGKNVIVYEWDSIGTYLSDFTATLSAATPVTIGFIPTTNGEGKIYLAQLKAADLSVSYFMMDGTLIQHITVQPSTGKLFGFAFGRVNAGEDMRMVLGVQQSNKPSFEMVDASGVVVASIKKEEMKPQKFTNLYFGK